MPLVNTTPFFKLGQGWVSVTQNNSIPFGTTISAYANLWRLPDDTILVHNGYHPTYGKQVAIFNPATGLWTAKGDMPAAAIRGTATFNPATGKPVLAAPQITETDIYEYTSGTDTWALIANFAPYHHDTAAVAKLPGGDVFAFSNVSGGYVGTERNSGTRWDGVNFTVLVDIPDIPVATWAYHGIFASANGYVYLIGGQNYSTSLATSNVYRYDPALNTWTTAANNLPEAHLSSLVIPLSDGYRALVLGGGTAGTGGGSDEVYIFDSTTETFSAYLGLGLPENGVALSTALNAAGGVLLADGNVMVLQNSTLWKTLTPP